MLPFIPLLFALSTVTDGATTNDCSKFKNCASCVKARRLLPGFQRFCGWYTDKSTCGEPVPILPTDNVVVREPFMCPEKLPTNEEHCYTDAIGRSLFGLTLAVVNKDPTECLLNSQPDVQLIKRYEVECDQSHNLCAAMLAVSKRDRKIFVVYKSSNMDKQLITEFVHVIAAQLGVWQDFEGGGGVLTYFHTAFERLFKGSGMKDDLIKLKETYPGYEVWCTGHSLGGSMSSMTALYLVKKKIFQAKFIRLVTFGEPRTGNVAFARAVEENVKVRYRVVHRGDLLTNMPSSIHPIGLLLPPTIAERQAFFYRYLVFYDNDMKEDDTFHVCALSGDYACRNLVLANNLLDHTNYFNINPTMFLSGNCKDGLLKKTHKTTTTTTTTTEITSNDSDTTIDDHDDTANTAATTFSVVDTTTSSAIVTTLATNSPIVANSVDNTASTGTITNDEASTNTVKTADVNVVDVAASTTDVSNAADDHTDINTTTASTVNIIIVTGTSE